MKRKQIILLAIVAIVLPVTGFLYHLSNPREFFVSSKQARPSNFKVDGSTPTYRELFLDSLVADEALSTNAPISSFQVTGNKIEAQIKDPSEKSASCSVGKRYQTRKGTSNIFLPTGQSIKLLAIARNRIEDIQPEGENLVPATWFDPLSLSEISNPEKLGLTETPYVWRYYGTLVVAFEMPEEEAGRSIQWHNPHAFDRHMQTRVHEMARWRKLNGILYYALDYRRILSSPIDIHLTIGCGEPEEVDVDIRQSSQKTPAIFKGTGTQLSVFHFTDGWVKTSGESRTKTSFEWNPQNPKNRKLVRVLTDGIAKLIIPSIRQTDFLSV